MSAEHASDQLISSYALDGAELAGDQEWAVEAHLESCAACRERLAAVAGPAVSSVVGDVWSRLEPQVAAAATSARRSRASWLTTWASPVMVPWLGMTVFVALTAMLLDRMTGSFGATISPVLLVAPVLPVLGVAASWARGLDPAYELTASTPRAGLGLVLRRTTSVLAVVIPVLMLVGWATGTQVGQWLLPCLAFTTGTLALGGLVGVSRAAITLVVVWAGVIAAPALVLNQISFALQSDALPVWGAIFALGVVVVVVRRGAYTVLGAHQ